MFFKNNSDKYLMLKRISLFLLTISYVVLIGCKNPLSSDSNSSIGERYRPGIQLPAKLEFSTQPIDSINGLALGAAPAVVVKDDQNNIINDYEEPIILTIASNPSSGTLTGTTSVVPSNGVAVFNDISIDQAGTGYTLSASTAGLIATSNDFNVISYRPSSVAITADKPLEYYSVDLTTTITPTETSLNATGTGSAPTGGDPGSGGGITTSAGSGITAPLGGGYTGTGFTTINAGSGFSATATVTSSFPSGATGACNILSPFSTINCLLSSFIITGSDLITTGSLTLIAYATNGGAQDYLNATSIPVRRKVIEKFMVGPSVGKFNNSWGYDLNSDISVTLNGKMYFVAGNSHSVQKLFVTDGTSIQQLTNTTHNQSTSDDPIYLTVFNNKVYFIATDETGFARLFVTDGVSTTKVSNTSGTGAAGDFSGGVIGVVFKPTVVNNKLFISLLNTSLVRKIYSVNTAGTLSQVSDIRGSGVSDNPNYFSSLGGNLYFSAANTGNYRKVYKTDGSTLTTVSNTRNSIIASDVPIYNYATSDALYFWANDTSGFQRLYKTDGTSIKKITNNCASGDRPTVVDNMFAQVGSVLYFWGNNTSCNSKLFKYDGTDLIQISDSVPGFFDIPGPLYVLGTDIYYVGSYTSIGYKRLFKYDGSTMTLVSNTSGTFSDDPYILGTYDNDLYFISKNSSGYYKLYKTNGTTVSQVMDITPGAADFNSASCSSDLPVFYTSGDKAFFSAISNGTTCEESLFRIRSL